MPAMPQTGIVLVQFTTLRILLCAIKQKNAHIHLLMFPKPTVNPFTLTDVFKATKQDF